MVGFLRQRRIMKNVNNKLSIISKFFRAKYKYKTRHHGPLKNKGRIKCLGGVSNPCRPIASTVLSFSYRESCDRGKWQNLENAIIGENETKLLNCAVYQILGAIL